MSRRPVPPRQKYLTSPYPLTAWGERQQNAFEPFLLARGAPRPKKGGGISGKEKVLMKALQQL